MTGQACRQKGRKFEREVRKELAQVLGEDVVHRGEDIGSRADVVAPGFWIECKAHKRANPRRALRQARRGAGSQPVWPIAITKDDRKPANVMMTLADFVDFLRDWHSLRCA